MKNDIIFVTYVKRPPRLHEVSLAMNELRHVIYAASASQPMHYVPFMSIYVHKTYLNYLGEYIHIFIKQLKTLGLCNLLHAPFKQARLEQFLFI